MADSSTGGYLRPVASPDSPVWDDAFEDQMQSLLVGITGMEGRLVRPRWQPVPPAMPDQTQNWCAIGIVSVNSDYGRETVHHPAGEGSDEVRTHETIELLASFYGPGCYGLASVLRDGLYLPQNREAILGQGMALLDTGRLVTTSDLVGTVWRRRVDLDFRLRRRVVRRYEILNLLSAQGSIHTNWGGPPQDFTVSEN